MPPVVVRWTCHTLQRLASRGLTRAQVLATISEPDAVVDGEHGRKVYQRQVQLEPSRQPRL